jgi:hypothetical protein
MLTFDVLYSRQRFFQMYALCPRRRCIFNAYVRRDVLSTALLPDACAVLLTALYLSCMRVLSMRCTPDDFQCAVLSSAPHVDAVSRCSVLSSALYLLCLLSMRCTLYTRRRFLLDACAVLATVLYPDACAVLSTAQVLSCLRSTRCTLDGASFRSMRCTLDSDVSFMHTFDALYSKRRFFQMPALTLDGVVLSCLRSTRCTLDGASPRCMRCTLDGVVSFMLTFDALYSRRRFFQMPVLYYRRHCIFHACAYFRCALPLMISFKALYFRVRCTLMLSLDAPCSRWRCIFYALHPRRRCIFHAYFRCAVLSTGLYPDACAVLSTALYPDACAVLSTALYPDACAVLSTALYLSCLRSTRCTLDGASSRCLRCTLDGAVSFMHARTFDALYP